MNTQLMGGKRIVPYEFTMGGKKVDSTLKFASDTLK
jgi:hypothetical protein